MRNRPTKLLVVRNQEKAEELSKIFGEDWKVVGVGSALGGRRFDTVCIVDQPERGINPTAWRNYVDKYLKTKLTLSGKLIEIY